MTNNNYLDAYKTYQKYLHSDENKLICQPFVSECRQFADIARRYGDKCQLLYEELSSNVVDFKYSTGGEVLHRGYYCPSPILDIVIGNGKRGKLIQRLTAKSKPTYRYGFDSQNELIVINILHLDESEIIIQQGEKKTGIWFSRDFDITGLSMCIYDNNKISSYVFCHYYPFENRIVDYRKEEYMYSAVGLDRVDTFNLHNDKKAPILQHEQYCFQHDNEGYLSKYTVKQYKGESIQPTSWDDHIFEVKIKRKV